MLLIFTICRILFLLFNYEMFRGISAQDLAPVFLAGLLFDSSALLMINGLFLFLALIPFPFRQKNFYKKILSWTFLLPNAFFLLFNVSDIGYYPYTLNRSSMEVLSFATGKVDIWSLLPEFLSGYWYLLLVFGLFVGIMIYADKKILYRAAAPNGPRYYLVHSLILLLTCSLALFIYRGGFRLRPIHMVDASSYAGPEYAVLILNTPFNMLKSLETGSIQETDYMPVSEEKKLFDPVYRIEEDSLRKKNVIIFILESFSAEYMGRLTKNASYTPFLDSLSDHGLLMTRCIANGKRSIEAMPAVVAGIPSLMPEPYITSVYGTNTVNALPRILKKYGYRSSFFHGATNGSMGFDSYAASAGFDRYFGRTEYNNDHDADMHWGIWDGPFLKRFAKEMDAEPQPFFSTLFTLSSHHPYFLPKGMEGKYPDGPYPIHRTIRYTDDQLRNFFKENKHKGWFQNSLFVFVADHTGISSDPLYMNVLGQHYIPLLFYSPSDTMPKIQDAISQQCDIMPTILDFLDVPGNYYGYGRSLLADKKGFGIFHISGQYHYVNDSLLILFNGEKVTAVYNHRKDRQLQFNLADKESTFQGELLFLKALIQRYNRDMIRNRLRVE